LTGAGAGAKITRRRQHPTDRSPWPYQPGGGEGLPGHRQQLAVADINGVSSPTRSDRSVALKRSLLEGEGEMDETKLKVSPRSVFAAVLLKGTEGEGGGVVGSSPTVVDLTKMIVHLKENYGLDTSRISMRADKGGWTSDDLSSFVNGFVLFGLASQNPIRLAAQAREECEEVLKREATKHPDEIRRLTEALSLRLQPSSSTAPEQSPLAVR